MSNVNPLKLLNNIFDLIARLNLSPNEQLILLHIFNLFNRNRWPDQLPISDNALLKITNLKISLSALRAAKHHLQQLNLLHFSPGSGSLPTTYRPLPLLFKKDSSADTPADTPAGGMEGVAAGFIGNGADTPCRPPAPFAADTPENSYIHARARINETKQKKGDAPAEIFLREWREATEYELRPHQRERLPELLERFGLEELVKAVRRASDCRRYVSFNDFLEELPMKEVAETAREPPLKLVRRPNKSGGMKNEQKASTAETASDSGQAVESVPVNNAACSQRNDPVGTVKQPVGTVKQPVGTVKQPVGTVKQPVGTVKQPVGTVKQPVGTVKQPVGTVKQPVGTVKQPVGKQYETWANLDLEECKRRYLKQRGGHGGFR